MSPFPQPVVWASPSADAAGSMPLGNGDIALNLWVEPSGDVLFYIAKSDTWGEFGQLYKVGKVRLRFLSGGSPLLPGADFRWELRPSQGIVLITCEQLSLRIWVDAHHPCIQLHAIGPETLQAQIAVELWRTARRVLHGREQHGLHSGAPYPVWHDADIIPSLEESAIAWFHHNTHSTWRSCLELQSLGDFANSAKDPLLHRTFGGYLRGKHLRKLSDSCLSSAQSSPHFSATITLLTLCPATPEVWLAQIRKLAHSVPEPEDDAAFQRHSGWWSEFWQRSWICADGNEAARKVTHAYNLQRFLHACAGRGAFPIKFNGSLFTADWNVEGEAYDADFRRWGPGYWHQNTRLPYWAMLPAGDFDLMRPYFQLYRNALPLAMERCRKFCGHAGAFFPETMYFWGAYLEHNYGWPGKREPGLAPHLPENRFIRFHNSGGLEVVFHALEYFRYTNDDDFFATIALPLAEAVLDYYDLHFPRRRGKLVITPAQAIEQWFIAENPMPEIAGLHACLESLLNLDERLFNSERRKQWLRFQSELPELPIQNAGGKRNFAPADSWEGPPHNSENPELYAIFPYRRCGIGAGDLEAGIQSFRNRTYKHDIGWAQDGMQAALLGLTEDVRRSVTNRFTTPSPYARFPAFWGPGFDWIPDQDQGASASHAFQLMCLQVWGETLYAFPAWPAEWTVDFRLRAPNCNSVFGTYRRGGKPCTETEKPATLAPIPKLKEQIV